MVLQGVCVYRVCICMCAQLLVNRLRNVVSDSAVFSISNAVVFAKYSSSACLLVSLISCVVACSARIETDRQTRCACEPRVIKESLLQ